MSGKATAGEGWDAAAPRIGRCARSGVQLRIDLDKLRQRLRQPGIRLELRQTGGS